jgi:hypothetical protein
LSSESTPQKEEDDPTLEKNLRKDDDVVAPAQFDMIQLPERADKMVVHIRPTTTEEQIVVPKGAGF